MLSHIDDYKEHCLVLMNEITEKDEAAIDKAHSSAYGKTLYAIDNKVIAEGRNILAYGRINLNDDSDIELIKGLNILNPNVMDARNIMPSNFDYDRGSVHTNDDGKLGWYSTWDAVKWFKYNHCLIGKPRRIIIYKVKAKDYVNIINTIR